MYSLRRRTRNTEREHAAAANTDTAAEQKFVNEVTAACIDLIDLPLDIPTQRRLIELLQHRAAAAEQAISR